MTIWNQLGIIGTTFEFEIVNSKWNLPFQNHANIEFGHYQVKRSNFPISNWATIVYLETYILGISPKPKWVTNNRK